MDTDKTVDVVKKSWRKNCGTHINFTNIQLKMQIPNKFNFQG